MHRPTWKAGVITALAFPGRVARMGGENLVGLNRAVREAAGVAGRIECWVIEFTGPCWVAWRSFNRGGSHEPDC